MSTFKTNAFIILQYLTPQHLISRLVGSIAASEISWIKNQFIKRFAEKFDISLEEAQIQQFKEFKSFNHFFTRALLPEARPIDETPDGLCSPADGAISQLGKIEQGRVFQAKGFDFSVAELLADDQNRDFDDGDFCTIYLSPSDYHRLHMPCDGRLTAMTYIPGDLFSVNTTTAENVPRLFSRNERLVAFFDTEHGPMAMVLVGAMIVASIETVWSGVVCPKRKQVEKTEYPSKEVFLKKGEQMGQFLLGSTVLLLLPKDLTHWQSELESGSKVQVGEKLAQMLEQNG